MLCIRTTMTSAGNFEIKIFDLQILKHLLKYLQQIQYEALISVFASLLSKNDFSRAPNVLQKATVVLEV